MPSEAETPLLTPQPTENPDFDYVAIYDRFSPRQKMVLLAIISWCGLMPLLISESFVLLVRQIAKDLDTTPQAVSLSISLSIFASALGGLSGGSYSTFYGRRPVYLSGLVLLIIGSLGVAYSRSIAELMFCRFFQVFGASPGASVGAGVIGDIYKLEQRGAAMGIFLAAILLGPTLAPLAGGLAAHYASWRIMQLIIAAVGFLALICMFLFFPETTHPGTRGIDKIRTNRMKPGRKIKFINPLGPLWLLRSPLLMAMSIFMFSMFLGEFAILTPIAYTMGLHYNIRNEVILGACLLPNGLGNIVGAPIAGRISDRIVTRYRQQRGGVWYPEDRLRVALFSTGTLVPLSALFFGLLNDYVPGKIGLMLNLVCLFMNGVGVQMVVGPVSAYLVDIMHSRSAEAVAANRGFRAALISVALAGTFPLLDWVGIALTYALFALVSWAGFGGLWYIIRHGDRMRAWKDVGFTVANN